MIRLYGREVDISNFDHPGGPVIRAAVGLDDATALFEMHHPLSSRAKALKALNMRYTRSAFDNINNRAFDDLNDRVSAVISDEDVEVAAENVFRKGVLLFSLVLIAIYYHACGSMVASAVLPWLMYMFAAQAMHEAGHSSRGLRFSSFLCVLAACIGVGGNPRWVWKHLRHHGVTNQPNDPELHVLRFAPNSGPRRWYHAGIRYYVPILYSLLHVSIFWDNLHVQPKYERAGVRVYNDRPWVWEFARVMFVFLHFVLPFMLGGSYQAILYELLFFCPASFVVSLLFQVAHLGTHGDVAHEPTDDWVREQMENSRDYHADSMLVTELTGGLNLQLEHHLFPTIPHVLLPRIHKVLGADSVSFAEAVRDHFRWLARL